MSEFMSLTNFRQVGDHPPIPTTESVLSTFFRIQASQLMYFYLFLAQDKPEYLTTYLSKDDKDLLDSTLEIIAPVRATLSVRDQVVYMMKLWLSAHDVPEYSRELWFDQINRARLTSMLDTVYALSVHRPQSEKLAGKYVLHSPITISYLSVDGKIQSWVQPHRIQLVDSNIQVVQYQFGKPLTPTSQMSPEELAQVASLGIAGAMHSSVLHSKQPVRLMPKPKFVTVMIDSLKSRNGAQVIFKNPEDIEKYSVAEEPITLTPSQLRRAAEYIHDQAEYLNHPDNRDAYRAYLREKAIKEKSVMPTLNLALLGSAIR